MLVGDAHVPLYTATTDCESLGPKFEAQVETVTFAVAGAVYKSQTLLAPTEAHGLGPSSVASELSYGNWPLPTGGASAQVSLAAQPVRVVKRASAHTPAQDAKERVIMFGSVS
jgi:hypothetical protein